LPPWLDGLMSRPEQITVVRNDQTEIERFVLSVSRAAKEGVAG
jgi:threonine synthase